MYRPIALLLVAFTLPEASWAQASPLFGPKRYTRDNGSPQVIHDTFGTCEPTSQYEIEVVNGSNDGAHRVSSATIMLNGSVVVRSRDLNEKVDRLRKPVTLNASNVLSTTLRSVPGGFLVVSIRCVSNCFEVQITSPSPANLLNTSQTNVFGSVSTGSDEVGVVVNGVSAFVQDGRFEAFGVPLRLGTQTLTATATNSCGLQAISGVQVEVTALDPPLIRIRAAPSSGTSPLGVTFSADVASANPISELRWDFEGDGVTDARGSSLDEVSHVYAQPGLYTSTLVALDTDGNHFSASVPVLVMSFEQLNSLLRGRLRNFGAALLEHDLQKALTFVHPNFSASFRTVFSTIEMRLPTIFASVTDTALLSAAGGVAEVVTLRNQEGVSHAYFVHFMQDDTGLWKIVGM